MQLLTPWRNVKENMLFTQGDVPCKNMSSYHDRYSLLLVLVIFHVPDGRIFRHILNPAMKNLKHKKSHEI